MKKTLVTLVLVAVFATGCPAVSNLRLNEELTNLYVAQIAARDEKDVVLSATIESGFRSVSTRAEEKAVAATEDADAISFYRIAATAAWQGRSDNVDVASEAGWQRCTDAGVGVAPRDCFMLLIIPDLAATDSLTKRLGSVNDEIKRLPGSDDSDAVKEQLRAEAVDIFGSLKNRFIALLSVDEKFGSVVVPAELDSRMSANLVKVFCRMQLANGAILRTSSLTDAAFVAGKETLKSARTELEKDTIVKCPS